MGYNASSNQPDFVNNSDGFIISHLSLDVGQLLADETVSHSKYVDSSDMPLFPCHVHPTVSPAHNAPLAKAKNLLDLDVGLRRLAEEVLPKLSTASFPEYTAPSGAGSVFSKMQSSLISCIIPATSWRLKASLNSRTTRIADSNRDMRAGLISVKYLLREDAQVLANA